MKKLFAALVVLFAIDARADVIPIGYRHYRYDVTFENLEAFPDWVFYVYPTSSTGRAYVVESGLSPVSFSLWPQDGRKGTAGSSLWAMKKQDFANVKTDEQKLVGTTVPSVRFFSAAEASASAPKSNVMVGPPKAMARDNAWATQLSRTYRVERVGAAVELALTKNEIRNKDGATKLVPVGDELLPFEEEKKETPLPKRSGCL